MVRPTTRLIILASLAALGPAAAAQVLPAAPNVPRPAITALDARWMLTFRSPPVAPAGFDRVAAYVPLANELVAIDLATGTLNWSAALSTTFKPSTGDGLVFAIVDQTAIALEQTTGATVWTAPLGATPTSPLYWDAGDIVVSAEGGEIIALEGQSGSVRWRQTVGAALAVPPSSAGERLFLALADNRVIALSYDNGQLLWTRQLDAAIAGILALDEQVLAGTDGNRLHSLSPDRGRIEWTQKAGADLVGAPAADEDLIYFAAFDNVLRALNRGNGNVIWTRNLTSRPLSGPLLADRLVYVPYTNQIVAAFNVKDGTPAFVIGAVSELGAAPYIREVARPTLPRLMTMTRDGTLQAFAPRYEAPPIPLVQLPGVAVANGY